MPTPITIASQAEKWRLRCLANERYPDVDEGHANWFPIDGIFRCKTCAKQARTDPRVDPEYEVLMDTSTGEYLARHDVVLAVERQPAPTGV